MTLFRFLLFSLLFSFVVGDCSDSVSCKDCLGNAAGCGWCAATRTCLPGKASGPTTGTCYGVAWHFGDSKNCPQCDSFKDCRSCLEYNSDCFWCNSSSTCHTNGEHIGCQSTFTQTCPCELFSYSCSACITDSRGNCGYCRNTMECLPRDSDKCDFMAHSCTCNENKDCGSCSNAPGCGWCTDSNTCESIVDGAPCLVAHNCQTYCETKGAAGCEACSNLNGCGWCPSEKKCYDASRATCIIQHKCSTCESHLDCTSCNSDSQCEWCSGVKDAHCIPKGSDKSCAIPTTCDAYCLLFDSCETCSVKKGCGWCKSDDVCYSLETTSCPIALSCPEKKSGKSKKGGFDGGSFVGGMFLVIGILVLGGVGFLVYGWKFSEKGKYTELS